jgi:hypothetical protein
MTIYKILLTVYIISLSAVSAAQHCDSTLWQKVYHPARLRVLDSCVAVTGTIQDIRKEKDGDVHISLKLDSDYNWMLAPGNYTRQHGCLVVEIIPGTDSGWSHAFKRGMIVRLSGAFVEDIHHRWNEIHPVQFIAVNN